MSIQNIAIKVYANGGTDVDQDLFIPVFQEWIKNKKLDDVMIDIADYRHVPSGPGMMLVCHEANYGLDSAEGGALGLLVQRKQAQEGDHAARILGVITSTLTFIKQLQEDPNVPDSLTFDLGSFEYLANDRVFVANTDEGYDSVKADLEAAGTALFGGDVQLERRKNHPKARLAVRVTGSSTDSVDALLQRLSA